MYGMEGDIIHGVYKSLIFVVRNGIASMAFERVIVPEILSDLGSKQKSRKKLTANPSPQHTFDAALIAYSLEIRTTKLTESLSFLLCYPQQSHCWVMP